ncbi:glycosyltransferase [Nonomuraea ferruginea]
MRPLLITMGSRGDVQPYLALARGLMAAGHRPLLAAPRRFGPLAAAHEVEFAPLTDEMLALQDTVRGQGVRAAITAAGAVKPMLRRLLDDQAALTAGPADVVVYHPKSLGGPYVAEKLGVPALAGLLLPLYLPTAAFPSPILPVRVPRALNRASWRISSAVEAPYRGTVREWRAGPLGLRGRCRPVADLVRAGGVLHAWSPYLLPAPPPTGPPTPSPPGSGRCPLPAAGRRPNGWPGSWKTATRPCTSASAAHTAATRRG